MKTVRCAIYTRKSSEEGLEQGFNSLDAQREACAAYVLSQASEGWTALPDIYDDGGISGGTLERSALQRLLADIATGRIDIVVVYKVDRLTRSLLDFSKLVEAFDKAGTSFVSITQSFNTTTSMGRLTLNMLLSFAQFEREVTAERIRDKIAASKAKGMWMGGVPPLGYAPSGRSLVKVEDHAALVRRIFERYRSLSNVRLLNEQLSRDGIVVPVRTLATGRKIGGGAFSRGQLYAILRNRIYIGEVVHGENIYSGQHPPLLDRALWDEVQAMLTANRQGTEHRRHASQRSALAGKVFADTGEPLLAVHACKGKLRYRYYVSRGLHQGTSSAGLRVPARELEAVVAARLAQALDEPLQLVTELRAELAADAIANIQIHAHQLAAAMRAPGSLSIAPFVERVTIAPDRVVVRVSNLALTEALSVNCSLSDTEWLELHLDVRLTTTGRVVRLVNDNGRAVNAEPDLSIIRLIVQARRWWSELREGELDVTRLARREGLTESWVTRVLRLAFLAPEIVAAALVGGLAATVSTRDLLTSDPIAAHWGRQGERFLPPSVKA